jgi:hypothetical protein
MNRHLIEVRYIPATARKPARISLTSHWDDSRVILSYPDPFKYTNVFSPAICAMDYLCHHGFDFDYKTHGEMKRGYFIIVNEFKSLKGRYEQIHRRHAARSLDRLRGD